MDDESSRYDKLVSMLQDGSSEPRNLPLEYLRNITNNFSEERVLGEGGFGTVYKGVLQNGETIAVKKLISSIPGVKDRHFENEARHLMRLKHPNVVLLVAWCSETENLYVQYEGKYIWAEKSERLLCLEYMPKGCLREYLSDEASGLCWDLRYKIIKGICYGLHYLHEEWHPNAPIIHMDLKPANILLDSNMVPKIADFGLSRLFSEEKTWTRTTSRDGTLGYMAPEYINRGLITTKSDIFSLGVIIIEIVSGHRDYPDETGIPSQEFIELVMKNWRNRMEKTPDYTYAGLEIYYQQIRRCIEIGLVCLKFDRSKRPTTIQIINMLHGSENEDFGGRKELYLPQKLPQAYQHWTGTSGGPHKYTSSLVKESQSRKRSIEIDLPTTLTGSTVYTSRPNGTEPELPVVRDDPIEAPERPASLDRPQLTWADVKRATGGGGINGVRPQPLLKPPPTIALPVVCWEGSTWDILRSFAPDENDKQQAPASRSDQDAVEKEEEDNASTCVTAGSMFYISPKGKVRKKIQSWMRGELLGSGTFGTVYEAISDEGVFFAVKEVNLFDQGSIAQQCIFQLQQEIALLSQFEHENIVQYYDTDKEDSKLYIFLELVTQGSLASLYQKYRLQDAQVSAYTRQILNGLIYLHERNIVHRDIKCANILVHANGFVKLADFGLAKEITKYSAARSCKGTVFWMAPEVVNPKKTYGPAADVWSLGCTVLEMLTRQNPYPDMEWTQALLRIGKGEAPPIPKSLSNDAYDFISQCVKANPEDRPAASDLLEHQFINRSVRSGYHERRPRPRRT